MKLFRKVYEKYPLFLKAIEMRHESYNETVDYLEALEKKGEVLLIRPSQDPKIGRMERNPKKVQALYELGYKDAMCQMDKIKEFIKFS